VKKISILFAMLLFAAPVFLCAQTISGHLGVCLGASRTTLSISTSGGAWSSGDVTKATIDAGTGEVTGVAAGTATISYTIAPATLFTAVVTVNAVSLTAIGFSTGPGYLCTSGSTITCTVAPMSGNAWSSSNTAVATVNSGGLVVPTSTAGTSIITYHHGAGNCNVTRIVSVYPTPTVSLSSPMCNAASQTATATPGGGTWASSNTSVATINSSTGDMTGHAGGSTNISYTTTIGCRTLTFLSVANLPGTISGTLSTCMGGTTTLSSSTSGGVWSSGTPSVATIGAGTGIVTPVSAGTADITYTAGTGCVRTAIVTINAALTSNTGNALVCVGQSTTLSNPTSGGIWSSSATSKATVGYYSGNVNAISAGTANITYSMAGGCRAITEVTVNGTMATISGTTSVCVGETTTLSHAISGGTWSSSNTTSATIDMTSGLVSGVAPGYSIITYTVSSGCYKTIVVYVRALPAGISGTTSLCPGAGTILTDGTTGGTWSSSNTAIATIGATNGLLIGVSTGTTTITYRITSTGCITTTTATIATGPDVGTITGASTVDVGSTIALSNAAAGGSWTSSSTSIATVGTSGIVTGVAAGTANITYTVSNSCGIARATLNVTVNAGIGAITGGLSICSGSTTTLNDTTSGGNWTSSNAAVATIGSATGIVNGISAGTATISYTVAGISVTAILTVNAIPSAGTITGASTVDIGATTLLSNTATGGSWTSSNTSVATISGTGTVSGIAPGTTIISYTKTNSCGSSTVTTSITVNIMSPISGTLTVCPAATTALASATSGGSWTSNNTGVATVGSGTAIVTGISAGTAVISYAIGSVYVTAVVTVNAATNPGIITGASSVNIGATIALSNAVSGGTWSTSTASIATVGSTGIVTGTGVGTATISYAVSGTCGVAYATKAVTGTIFTIACPLDWSTLGTVGFSLGLARYASIALAPDNTPYVVYCDDAAGYNAYVKTFTSGSWVTLGGTSVSGAGATSTQIVTNSSGVPYVAFNDSAYSYRITVKKFDGSSWITVGTPGFSGGTASRTQMAFDGSGALYVGCQDHGYGDRVRVRKFNGSAWVDLGGNVTAYSVFAFAMAVDASGTVYVGTTDGTDSRAKVVKYNGSAWVVVGASDFTSTYIQYASMAISSTGTPYLSFEDGATNRARVMKFDGTSWVDVGSDDISENEIYSTDIRIGVNDTPYIAFSDFAHYTVAVKKFNGSSWVDVGATGFSGNWAHYITMAMDNSGRPYVAYADDGYGQKMTVKRYTSVPPSVGNITGISTVNVGATITFTPPMAGGLWTSTNPDIASVAGGIVTGVSVGTTTISYTLIFDCDTTFSTKLITVHPEVDSLLGREWGTYVGGSGNDGGKIAVDDSGSVYLAGNTTSNSGIAMAGAHQGTLGGNTDAYLKKINSAGECLWATYFGGSENEQNLSVATDHFGNVYIAGVSSSTTGIVTAGCHQNVNAGTGDAYVAKFSGTGVLKWATYFGGSEADVAYDVQPDDSGNVYLAGYTRSSAGIATTGTQQFSNAGNEDGFIAKFDSSGTRIWGTYFGGAIDDRVTSIAISSSADVYLTGYTSSTTGIATSGVHSSVYAGGLLDAFVAKFTGAGMREWATYYGGSGYEYSYKLKLTSSGQIVVAGNTNSSSAIASSGTHMETLVGSDDAFLAKFSNTGGRIWGTYYGGSGSDGPNSLDVDDSDNIYVSGYTNSSDGISTPGALQNAHGGGGFDLFLAKLDSSGARDWGTYFGNTGYETGGAATFANSIFLAGNTSSTSGIATDDGCDPTHNGGNDAFVVKLNLSGGASSRPAIGRGEATLDLNQLSVFPNPSKGNLSIQCTVGGLLTIYNIDGREAGQYKLDAGTTNLQLPNNTAPGIYVLRFRGKDGISKIERLVYER
jgi:uncharacterized protein YjdB